MYVKKSTLAAFAIGLSMALSGGAFADTTTKSTTTEQPNGQKSTNSTTNDSSTGKSVSNSTSSNPATGQSMSSTTTQHSDGTKTTDTTQNNANK